MTPSKEHARFLGAMFVTTVAHQASSMIDAAVLFSALALALFLMRDGVMDVLCGDSFLRDNTSKYMVSVLPWFILGNIATIMSEFVAMTGRPFLMTYCALVYFVTKLLADILFVGVLGWGIEWLGFASLVATLAALTVILPYCLKKDSPLRFIHSPFRQLLAFIRTNIHYGKGLLAVEVSYIVFSFAMNTLVLRYMGEKAFFCWSVVMMIYLAGDYAAAASQDTCLSLGGKYLGAGLKDAVRMVFRRSMLFAALWIALCLTMIFVTPDAVLPLFGAVDPSNYHTLLPVIAMTIAVSVGLNLVNLYLLRLVLQDRVRRFIVLIALLYLSVPLSLFLAHIAAPDYEWWGIVALLPLQLVLMKMGTLRWRGEVKI